MRPRAVTRAAILLPVCLGLVAVAPGCGAFAGPPALSVAADAALADTAGTEPLASWFGDTDGRILYCGLSPFTPLAAACEAAGGRECALEDLRDAGDHLIGRFDLRRGRWLPPLVVRPRDPAAPSSVWDVLVHSGGRIFYTTFFDEFGSVRPDGSDVRYHLARGTGLNEMWEGPGGDIYVTRYVAGGGDPANGNGGVAVFGPDGTLRREIRLPAQDGILTCPKSVAVDPRSGDIWLTTDIFHLGDGRITYDLLHLAPDGAMLERQADSAVEFVSFDAAGRGWFAERRGERAVVRVVDPAGPETVVDLGPRPRIDCVQDIKHAGDRTVLMTWGLRAYVVQAQPQGAFDVQAFAGEVPPDCPPGPVLGYTAVESPRGGVFATLTCGVRVLRMRPVH